LQILIDAIASKRKELDVDIQKLKEEGDQGIVVTQVHPYNDTAQAFFMVSQHPRVRLRLAMTALSLHLSKWITENLNLWWCVGLVQAKDRVEKYIHPDCKTILVVTKVERIENGPLQRKFLEAQRELFNPLEISECLFYGGPDSRLGRVVNQGFRAASKKVRYITPCN